MSISSPLAAIAVVALSASFAAPGIGSAVTKAAPPAVSPATGVTAPVTLPALTDVDAARLTRFWTPERMEDAVARSEQTESGGSRDAAEAFAQDDAVSVARQVPTVSHIGRVFYTLNGSGYACSANVVVSANRSTVATAAHCMTGGGNFSEDSVFVPAYEDGNAPYGEWPVIGGEIAGGFTENNADQADDTGFLVVARNDDGQDIQSVVGASPVAFNQALVQEGSVYGYPAEGRFDGESLQECSGVFQEYGPQQIDLPCDMNGGVSGGPIFRGDSADGTQYANEDARYEDYSHVLGPIWQDNEKAAYTAAAALRQ